MTTLAHQLGLSPDLEFYDVYSLADPALLSLIPRPVLALLVIFPLTPAWNASRIAEDRDKPEYTGTGEDEGGIIWFKQTHVSSLLAQISTSIPTVLLQPSI